MLTTVTVHPQADIEAGLVTANVLISIRGTGGHPEPVIPERFGGRILPLHFDDIPVANFRDRDGRDRIGPTRHQVEKAQAFARTLATSSGQHLAVHRLHGKSRSAATALAVVADQLGPGGEDQAVAALLADDPECRRTPWQVHSGQALAIRETRLKTLSQVYAKNPQRFVRKPPELPDAAWINPPGKMQAA